ncbi:MAG: alkaline phosphatase family protein [Nocardioidaceae bacterium]|nr:alkaline phosphatase family protein [Nocardioidaceae bacterium]
MGTKSFLAIRPSRSLRFCALLALCLVSASLFSGGTTRSSESTALQPTSAEVAAAPTTALNGKRVIAISIDGLNTDALTKLGRSRLPHLYRLIWDGAGTIAARSQVEMTVTLPNHTSMVTGRRIARAHGGHGVTWNTDLRSRTVQSAARHNVASVFDVVHAAGGNTAVFSTKSKFSLFDRSWPAAVNRSVIKRENNTAVTNSLRADLIKHRRDFYFLHLGGPDQTGHHHRCMSSRYLKTVRYMDRLVGSLMNTITSDAALRASTLIVLTSDHGGVAGSTDHSQAWRLQNYRVAFTVWGPGVPNTPLYRLNPTRKNPGKSRPGFSGKQPIRNGDVANLSLSILGLSPVPGSLWDRRQDLRWQ